MRVILTDVATPCRTGHGAQVKNRSTIIQEDKDIRDIRAGLMACEEHVKETETRVRRQHDYRFVLQYFSASRDLHRTLVANVNYLANEVEQLRANVDHSNESISIMEQQFVEIEVGAHECRGRSNRVFSLRPEDLYFETLTLSQ